MILSQKLSSQKKSEIVYLTLKLQIHETHQSNNYFIPIGVWETSIKTKRFVFLHICHPMVLFRSSYLSKFNYNKATLSNIGFDISNQIMLFLYSLAARQT